MFACQECGRKFKSSRAAEKAAYNGCPDCGGVDIDIDVVLPDLPPSTPSKAGESGLTSPPQSQWDANWPPFQY